MIDRLRSMRALVFMERPAAVVSLLWAVRSGGIAVQLHPRCHGPSVEFDILFRRRCRSGTIFRGTLADR